MLPAKQCLSPDFVSDCNLISNFTMQHKSPLGIIISGSHCLAFRTVQRWALEMKFTPSATPTHTLVFPAELATTLKGRVGIPWCRTPHSLPQAMHERETVFTKCHLWAHNTKKCLWSLVWPQLPFYFLQFDFFLLFYMLDISLKPGGINSSFN